MTFNFEINSLKIYAFNLVKNLYLYLEDEYLLLSENYFDIAP